MNEEILTNLSVIASFHNRNCSVLNAFLPIVEYGVSILFDEGHANHFDTQLLQDTIKQNTGIYINSISLKTLLKRLEKDKCITLFDRGQLLFKNGNHVRWIQTNRSKKRKSISLKSTV